MREARINLDWFDAEIEKAERDYLSTPLNGGDLSTAFMKLSTLTVVRSKCSPIEEQKETFLPPKCIQEWESAKYCQNENKCKLCKTIKQ